MDPIQQYALKNAMRSALEQDRNRPGIQEAGKGFAELFESMLGGANAMQQEARQSVDGLFTGEVTDVHEVMVAVNKADLSFRFLVEVRNKLQDAYRDLMTQTR